jgi:anti-sigma regulatory factor (Ser/Thr protein kinase)
VRPLGASALDLLTRNVQTQPQEDPTAVKLRHDAFVYDSDDRFASHMSRFLDEGMAEGAATVAITTRSNWSLLRDALGPRANKVHFTDRDSFYTRPARALAQFDATLRHHLGKGAPSVRVVGEVQFGPTAAEWDMWIACEAIANRAFAGEPAWIVCPYDERVLDPTVIESAACTHPGIVSHVREGSDRYGDPAALVRALTPEHWPTLDLVRLPAVPDAHAFRDVLASELAAAEVSAAPALDMLVAANEVYANATSHGGGVLLARAGEVHGRFVCEIADAGPGLDDPLAGYIPPKPDEGGAGLWIARQLVSQVELVPSSPGLVVRLWV